MRSAPLRPLQNPFNLDLPFDDGNDGTASAQRCAVVRWAVVPWAVVPWAAVLGLTHRADLDFSCLENRWVQITA
jgi:hypothetical protein